jgi:hypothetical protein
MPPARVSWRTGGAHSLFLLIARASLGCWGAGLGAPSHTDNAPCRAVVPVSRVKVAVPRRLPDPSTTMSVSTNLARRESHGMV